MKYHYTSSYPHEIAVYCSGKSYSLKKPTYLSANLVYLPLNANGIQSIPYDIISLLLASWNRSNVILLLGVSGAIILPLIRLFTSTRIITNIDGIEWRREKWRGLAKQFLRFSEKIAVRFSHEIISDNDAIALYVNKTYGISSHVISYGGDHAVIIDEAPIDEYELPERYVTSVCRIEPENNIHMILEAFSKLSSYNLVIVGNWNNSEYGKNIREQYSNCKNIFLLDPIYDLAKLKKLRLRAMFYIHGHSAGGTNPSLVEAMHFAKPILAFDCDFNRRTTEDKAFFFKSSNALVRLMGTMNIVEAEKVGRNLHEIAERRYTWKAIAQKYFSLIDTQSKKTKF